MSFNHQTFLVSSIAFERFSLFSAITFFPGSHPCDWQLLLRSLGNCAFHFGNTQNATICIPLILPAISGYFLSLLRPRLLSLCWWLTCSSTSDATCPILKLSSYLTSVLLPIFYPSVSTTTFYPFTQALYFMSFNISPFPPGPCHPIKVHTHSLFSNRIQWATFRIQALLL